MTPALKSAFDAALWFVDTALEYNEYLQPHKLQRLLFLSQAYFMVLYEGRLLMPACFVADEIGPVEPNVFAAFVNGRPNLEPDIFLPEEAEQLLSSVWRRFGHKSTNSLGDITNRTKAFKKALKKGHRTPIRNGDMMLSFARAESAPAPGQVVRPKLHRTQDGRPVQVKAWAPRRASEIEDRGELPDSDDDFDLPRSQRTPKPDPKAEIFRSVSTRGVFPGPGGTATSGTATETDVMDILAQAKAALEAKARPADDDKPRGPVSAETGKPIKVSKAPWAK